VDVSELEEIAYHEAGHAVAQVLLRLPFKHATIVAENPTAASGSCLTLKSSHRFFDAMAYHELNARDRKYLEHSVLSALAGPASQEKFIGSPPSKWSSTHDYEQAQALVMKVSAGERECQAYFSWLKVRAEELWCDANKWAMVQQVARDLLEQGTLTGRAVGKAASTCLKTRARRHPVFGMTLDEPRR
jgi:hypothetical protein